MKSEPEPDNPALLRRNEKYSGEHRYMICGPWRLVWQDNRLATVELRHLGVTIKPKLYPGEIRTSFLLRVTEYKDFTLVERAAFKNLMGNAQKMVFISKPEVNAIIRFLRLIGMDVEYKRTGTEIQRQAVLDIFLPKELRKFEIAETGERKIEIFIPKHERPYQIAGITGFDCRKILDFVASEAWMQEIKLATEERNLAQERKAEKRRRREEQERLHRKKIEERRQSKRSIAEILAFSEDSNVVWKELLKVYGKQIDRKQCKLGKIWIARYRFLAEGINLYAEASDVRSQEEARELVVNQLISKLRKSI